ncbi:MAG TPA: hypothetical protein DEA78_24120 [Cyanobacteria bacterium UBA11159]|nr:hypothetical protein [Cyanobacteria bacterium UBA11159]
MQVVFLLPPLTSRAVSCSNFEKARKQPGRDFQLLNFIKIKLGINYYEKPSFSPAPLLKKPPCPQFFNRE